MTENNTPISSLVIGYGSGDVDASNIAMDGFLKDAGAEQSRLANERAIFKAAFVGKWDVNRVKEAEKAIQHSQENAAPTQYFDMSLIERARYGSVTIPEHDLDPSKLFTERDGHVEVTLPDFAKNSAIRIKRNSNNTYNITIDPNDIDEATGRASHKVYSVNGISEEILAQAKFNLPAESANAFYLSGKNQDKAIALNVELQGKPAHIKQGYGIALDMITHDHAANTFTVAHQDAPIRPVHKQVAMVHAEWGSYPAPSRELMQKFHQEEMQARASRREQEKEQGDGHYQEQARIPVGLHPGNTSGRIRVEPFTGRGAGGGHVNAKSSPKYTSEEIDRVAIYMRDHNTMDFKEAISAVRNIGADIKYAGNVPRENATGYAAVTANLSQEVVAPKDKGAPERKV
jgi:hypothetical protein